MVAVLKHLVKLLLAFWKISEHFLGSQYFVIQNALMYLIVFYELSQSLDFLLGRGYNSDSCLGEKF